jgi:hypothetical protein
MTFEVLLLTCALGASAVDCPPIEGAGATHHVFHLGFIDSPLPSQCGLAAQERAPAAGVVIYPDEFPKIMCPPAESQ